MLSRQSQNMTRANTGGTINHETSGRACTPNTTRMRGRKRIEMSAGKRANLPGNLFGIEYLSKANAESCRISFPRVLPSHDV